MIGTMILDPQAALAADPAYAAIKREAAAEVERLRDLEVEQQTLVAKLAGLPVTAQTRKHRKDERASIKEIEFEIAAAAHNVKLRQRDVQRVQRRVATEVGTRIAESATSAGQTIEVKLDDVLAEFMELQALDVSARTARALVVQADRVLGEETPSPPTVRHACGLGEGVWATLAALREAVHEERQRRERLRHR